MTLYEFISLDDSLQYDLVWQLGKYVDTVEAQGKIYMLFAIDKFFVEITYNQVTNHILGKNQFEHGQHLDKYLPPIEIHL